MVTNMSDPTDGDQRRLDAVLEWLLKSPPKPRPKRDRKKAKITRRKRKNLNQKTA
jgi:hypothetical protein